MSENPLYNRVRRWCNDVGITDARVEFLCVIEEAGELARAMAASRASHPQHICEVTPDIRDAIGDTAVTLIALHHLDMLNREHPVYLEKVVAVVEEGSTLPGVFGLIAEGLRKPKKSHQVAEGCAVAMLLLQDIATGLKLDFEGDCLGPVLEVIEGRVKGGKLVNGTFVKEADLR